MNSPYSEESSQSRYAPYSYLQEPAGSAPAPDAPALPPGYPAPPPPAVGVRPFSGRPANGLGTAAMVLGICGLVTSWIPVLGILGWAACGLAIVFGAIGLSKAARGTATNKGAATAGLILGIAGLVIAIAIGIALWNTPATSTISHPPVEADSSAPEAADDGPRESASDESTAEQDDSASDESTAEQEEASPGLGEGVWEVGTEVEPGTYVTTVPGDGAFHSCYVARLSGFSGELEDVIANENFSGGARGRITISADDLGVEFSGDCEWQAASEADTIELGGSAGDGIWEVGSEIQPGTYVTQAEGDDVVVGCYVARLSGFSMDFEDIIANDYIDSGAQGRITIDGSDAGVQFSGGCVWERE